MNLNEAQRRIRWTIFIILAGVAVLLTILDRTGNLDSALAFVRNPLTTVISWTSARSSDAAEILDGPRDLQTARQEIARLQAQVDAQEREIEELREIQGEYQQLLDIFNRVRQQPDFIRLTASVIGQDTSPSLRSIIIDKGSEDGVVVGMPVESARGLVGQVFRTTANSAQVVLLTDNASSIPARLVSSRATGLLRGGGLGGSVSIDWIDLQYEIAIGEVVLTSGLGGKFPQDMVIGRIIEVQRQEAELFQRAIVQPAVDFAALEIVLVIMDFRPVDTEIFTNPPGN